MKLTPKQLNLRRQKDAYFSKLRWTHAQIAVTLMGTIVALAGIAYAGWLRHSAPWIPEALF